MQFNAKDKMINSESADEVIQWWKLEKEIATNFWINDLDVIRKKNRAIREKLIKQHGGN